MISSDKKTIKKEFAIINSNFGNFLINRYDLIGKHIEQTGNWELFLVEFYSKILNESDICIDAGANLGFHAIQFAKQCKKVYAFEPQPMIYNQLCANILFNDLDDTIIPYRLGLGEKNDIKQMWSIEKEDFGSEIYNWGGRGLEHEFIPPSYQSNEIRENDQITIISLDSLNIPKCDLFKIDIQGYELYAFQGAKELINKNKPVILLESSPNRSELDKQVLDMLHNIGYKCYRYCVGSEEDCILIHPESDKYELSLQTITELQNKYPLKNENISSYSISK